MTAAFYALKSGRTPGTGITLLEASSRLGGWVRSLQTPEGIIFEQGPRTIRPVGAQGSNTLRLVEDLGLSEHVIPVNKQHPTAQNRLIYANGQLNRIPTSLWSIFKTIPPFSKPLVYAILQDLRTKSVKKSDETLYDFAARRFGTEVADYLISAMICGICAGDAKKISVNFLMGSLFAAEQKHGGAIIGALKEAKKIEDGYVESDLFRRSRMEKWSVWSLSGGLETLIKTLGEELHKKVNIQTNTPCTRLEFHDSGVKVTSGDGEAIEAKHVISSLPAPKLGALVQHQHPSLSQLLTSIEHVNVAVVNLAYQNAPLKEKAFGFLVPPKENLPILGVIFDSCSFEQEDWTVLTVMMGGAWFEEKLKGKSNQEILEVATQYVTEILHMPPKADVHHVEILKECIPQYTLGHAARVKEIKEYIETHELPLYLAGSSYHGVGINDVILESKKAVDSVKWQHWGPQAA